MKQRLLLALLVLFAAAGMVKAQTSFTRETTGTPVTITVSGISGGNVSCTAAQESVKNSAGKNSWTFNVKSSETNISLQVETDAKYTGLVVNGNIVAATIDHANLTSLEFTNNGRKLTSLTLTDAALTSLKCNDCYLDALPSTNDAFGNTATICLENNNITAISDYPNFGKYDATHNRTVTIKLNNNKIVGAIPTKPSNSGVTVDYGTQNLSYSTPIKANEWFATITNLVKGTNKLFTATGLDYKDLTISWKLQNGSSSITTPNNIGDVIFYNGGKYYDGAVECTIKKKDNSSAYPTYVYSLTVEPAEFTLTKEVLGGGSLNVYNGSTLVTTGKVKVGDILTLVPKANDGFTFEKYENARGLKVTPTDPNKYEVTGDGEKPDVAITATFKALAYTVKHSGSANGTYKVLCDGEEVTNGSTVGYGKKFIIEAIPAASNYKTRVIVNGEEKIFTHVDGQPDKVEIDVSSFVSKTSASTINVEVIFEAEKEYSIGVTVPTGITVKINGTAQATGTKVDTKPGSTVVVEVTLTDDYKLNQILLNAKAISTSTKTTFTMPDQNVSLNFVVIQLTDITVNAKSGVTYTYTGNEQEFLYTTEPAGISDIKIQYSKDNGVTYTDKTPVDVGTYKIRATRAAKDGYKKLDNTSLTMTISKADPQITLPTVSVDNNNKYVITGGSAKLGSKSLTGTFKVTSDGTNSITNNVCVEAKSHIATLEYTVTGADKDNFNTAKVNVPVKYKNTDALSTFKLQWGTIPADMTLKVMNGAAEVANNTNVAIGTTLTFILTYARGYAAYIIENKSGADKDWNILAAPNLVIDDNNPAYIIKKITKTVSDPLEKLSITYTGAPTAKTLDVSIKTPVAAKEYIPAGQNVSSLYDASTNFSIKLDGSELDESSTPKLSEVKAVLAITYKDASGQIVPKPTAVGKYIVCVHIPAVKTDNATIKETNVEFKDKLEITKAKITLSDDMWPKTAILGVGQTLANASFEGGNAPVAGKFAFVDESKKAVDGESYAIKFVPDDKNYEELIADKTANVVFSNKRILLIDNIQNGSVTVKDNSGRVYNSKDELPVAITELIITATPAANYKLDKLTVNNATITNGSTYKLTESSITVKATFYASYKVTVTKPSKGAVVTLPSSSEVKKGESYSFTVACLTADKSKIVVKDGSTVITGTDGKYTISNITADKAISITLDNPTAITVAADTTLSPHKKPMGTVTITGATDGKCYYGETVTVKATPVSGVQFAGWVGRTETTATLSIKATEPSYKFKAKYAGSPTGIETIEGIRIYGSEGSIFIGCDGDARVTIISMEGRVKKAEISGDTRIEMAAGIYGVILEKGSEVMKTKVIVR